MIKATGQQVIILPDTPPDRINGIIVPVEARDPTNTGVVMDVKDNKWIKAGDRVAFNHRRGYEVPFEGVTYISITLDNICGKY